MAFYRMQEGTPDPQRTVPMHVETQFNIADPFTD